MRRTLTFYRSDVVAEYGEFNFRNVFKSFLNPNVRACVLVRLAASSNGLLHVLVRNVLIFCHSIDVGRNVAIGYGLKLPHPFGIVIGTGVRLGNNTTIYQCVTLGNKRGYPSLQDNVIIYPGAVVVGAIFVGECSVIGAGSFLDKSIGAGEVFKRQ